jgi:hypothetical protein
MPPEEFNVYMRGFVAALADLDACNTLLDEKIAKLRWLTHPWHPAHHPFFSLCRHANDTGGIRRLDARLCCCPG